MKIKNYQKALANMKSVSKLKFNTKKEEISSTKYLASILNQINRIRGKGETSPTKIGSVKDIFDAFTKSDLNHTLSEYKRYYDNLNIEVGIKNNRFTKKGKNLVADAIERNITMKDHIVKVLTHKEINNQIAIFIKDLIYDKTYIGLSLESLVFETLLNNQLSHLKNCRSSNNKEEAQGIDFVCDNMLFQVKPKTYQATSKFLNEKYANKIVFIYYEIIGKDLDITIKGAY